MTGFCGLGKNFSSDAHKSPQTWLVRWRNFENSWFNKTHNCFLLPKGLNGQCLFQSLSRLWEGTCHHPNLQHEGLESGSAGNQRDSRHKSWKYVGSSWKIEATGSLDHCQLLDSQKIWIDSNLKGIFAKKPRPSWTTSQDYPDRTPSLGVWRNNCENDKKNSQVLQKWSI